MNLCKEYLSVVTCNIPVLLQIKSEHFDILRHHIQELRPFKNSTFLGPPCNLVTSLTFYSCQRKDINRLLRSINIFVPTCQARTVLCCALSHLQPSQSLSLNIVTLLAQTFKCSENVFTRNSYVVTRRPISYRRHQLSMCFFVTLRYCAETTERMIMQHYHLRCC